MATSVEVIAELQPSGAESSRAIAAGLNARGIPTARGGTMTTPSPAVTASLMAVMLSNCSAGFASIPAAGSAPGAPHSEGHRAKAEGPPFRATPHCLADLRLNS